MIEVLSPVGRRRQADVGRSAAVASVAGTTVGLLWARDKGNAGGFLDMLAAELMAAYGAAKVVTATKLASAKPADPEALGPLRSANFVITAFAD